MLDYNKDAALDVLKTTKDIVEPELEKIYEVECGVAKTLYDAQKYALMAGGKRIRPALVLESCRMLGGDDAAALPFALAIEMVHTYSLIHDDLPCMDDDDMRRGKPTVHKVFGEAMAILAGDGLLTDAFSLCAMNQAVSGDCAAAAVGVLSGAAGSFGMVKGQVMDLYGESHELDERQLVELHMGKTGAMICASVQLGCLAAGIAPDDEKTQKLTLFAQKIGLVFQIIDDMLDVTANEAELGKKTGSDADNNKTTFMKFFSPEAAREYSEQLTRDAISEIEDIEGAERLIALALFLCDRNY
jgi:geranylgeranyl diphosphate synthase type II